MTSKIGKNFNGLLTILAKLFSRIGPASGFLHEYQSQCRLWFWGISLLYWPSPDKSIHLNFIGNHELIKTHKLFAGETLFFSRGNYNPWLREGSLL